VQNATTCLGIDSTTWSAAFNGVTSNVTISNDAGVRSTFETPLLVTHAGDCANVHPRLTLQMDTDTAHSLTVNSAITAKTLAAEDLTVSSHGGLGYKDLVAIHRFLNMPPVAFELSQTSIASAVATAGVVVNAAGDEFTFDGSTSYVSINRPFAYDFTVVFDIKTTQNNGAVCSGGSNGWWNGAGLFDAEVSGDADDFGISMCSGKIAAGIGSTGGNSVVETTATFNDGNWHSVRVLRYAIDGKLQVYVNGAMRASATGGNTGGLTAPTTVEIGRIRDPAAGYFAGTLRNMRAYYETAPLPMGRT
jgi:hypothetical protein